MKRLMILSLFVVNSLVASEENWMMVVGGRYIPIEQVSQRVASALASGSFDLCVIGKSLEFTVKLSTKRSKGSSLKPEARASKDLEEVVVSKDVTCLPKKDTKRKKEERYPQHRVFHTSRGHQLLTEHAKSNYGRRRTFSNNCFLRDLDEVDGHHYFCIKPLKGIKTNSDLYDSNDDSCDYGKSPSKITLAGFVVAALANLDN